MIKMKRCNNVAKLVVRRRWGIVVQQVLVFMIEKAKFIVDHILVIMRKLHYADSCWQKRGQIRQDFLKLLVDWTCKFDHWAPTVSIWISFWFLPTSSEITFLHIFSAKMLFSRHNILLSRSSNLRNKVRSKNLYSSKESYKDRKNGLT